MPLYEYECDACGHRVEVIQKFSDPPPAACAKCGGSMRKLFSSPAIQFKGSGFYITDYARAGKSDPGAGESGKTDGGASSSAESKDGAKGESKGEAKGETKTETKSDSKSESKSEAKTESKSESKSEPKSAKPSTPSTS